jgi:Anti-sigma-K factor rskA/Putative zinc-finger
MSDHEQYAEMLALYALDILDAPERAELEAHLRSCERCRAELEALRGDAALLALSAVGPAPPQSARQRFLAALANEPQKRPSYREGVVLGVLRRRWLTFAPIAATLLLVIFSLLLWRANLRLQSRVERTQAELDLKKQELHDEQQLVQLFNSPDTVRVTLVAAKAPRQPQAKTLYGPKMGHLVMMANNMEPLPPDKVYELWLLPMNGAAPMPAGTFKPNSKGHVMMDHWMESNGIEAKGFAITVEPEGGSQSPTAPIMMSGTG